MLNDLKHAILAAAAAAPSSGVHKMNLIGRPLQQGTIESSLGLKFSPDQRALAARAFDELRRMELIRPTFTDLVEPENWVEITDSGRKALATGTFEPPPAREREQKFGILWSLGQAERDFKAWSDEDRGADRSVGILFLDIDHFKDLNTAHTETVVDDAILRPFQQLLLDLCSHRGEVYRHGGDEFLVLLRNTGAKEGAEFAERLHTQLAAAIFPLGDANVRLTVSIGLASWPAHAQTYEETLKAANQAKREAKATRNIVRSASFKSTQASEHAETTTPLATAGELEKTIEWLESHDAHVRLSAAEDLLAIVYKKRVFHHEPVRSAIRRMMKDEIEKVRLKALEIFIRLMQSERDAVRRYYAQPLLALAEGDPSFRVRTFSMTAIGATGDTYYCQRIYLWITQWQEEVYRQAYPVPALIGLAATGLREKIRNDLRSLLEQTFHAPIKQRLAEALKAVSER